MVYEKHTENWFQIILSCFLTVLFMVFAGFLIYNTWPRESESLLKLEKHVERIMQKRYTHQTITTTQKTIQEIPSFKLFCFTPFEKNIIFKSISETTKTDKGSRMYTISQEELDAVLQTVAYSARKEAVEEYKNNLSILLTILAIFGIAWPVIMVLLQSRSFKEDKESLVNRFEESSKEYHNQIIKIKKDLDISFQRKMEKTYLEFADNSLANEWFWNFEIKKYLELIESKQAEIETADEDRKPLLIKEKVKLEKSQYALTKNRAKTLMKVIYFDALAGKISRANSKVDTLLDLLGLIKTWISSGKTNNARTAKEIDWELFRKKNVQDAKEIEEKFRNIYCLPWEEDSDATDHEEDSSI